MKDIEKMLAEQEADFYATVKRLEKEGFWDHFGEPLAPVKSNVSQSIPIKPSESVGLVLDKDEAIYKK